MAANKVKEKKRFHLAGKRTIKAEKSSEADGSVYCEVPAGIPIYFQALDERGRAGGVVQPISAMICSACLAS